MINNYADNQYSWETLTLRILKNAACDASVLIVAALAYERCYAITKPFKYQTDVSSPDRKPWKRLNANDTSKKTNNK